jgi:hypothetical protein
MLSDRLMQKGSGLAQRRIDRVIDALARVDLPPGVVATRDDHGITISGRGLRARMIRDIRLRSFADLVKGILQ